MTGRPLINNILLSDSSGRGLCSLSHDVLSKQSEQDYCFAEIQEESNLTYRVHDYDCIDADAKKRELLFDLAVSVMNMYSTWEV